MTTLREAIARAVYEAGRAWYPDKPTWEEAQEPFRSDVCADHYRGMADAALAAIEAAGWAVVPKEPTLDMVGAARDEADCIGDIYRAMLAAAPKPGGEQ